MAQADGHDGPGLIVELVPGVAAVVDESIEVIEHAVGEPVVADELPDVLLRVQLGALRRQRNDGDVVGHHELAGEMPSSLIYQQHRMTAWSHITEIAARWRFIIAVLHQGRIRPTALPSLGQMAPKM